MSRVKLLSVHVFLAVAFLIMLVYARCAGELQPLFLILAALLGVCALCYLWKTVVETSLFSYGAHAIVLGVIWALYWFYRIYAMEKLLTPQWATIVFYICVAFFTLLLVGHLCRGIRPTRKWAAALLVLYPASMIALTPAVTENPDQDTFAFHFGSVVAKIQFNGIAPRPHETYRYYTSTRTVSITEAVVIGTTPYTDLKLQSVYLHVDANRRKPDSAILEVIRKDGHVQYLVPRTVHFDESTFEVENPDGETIDGQLVIISNDSQPYDWDVFYLLPSASQTLDDQSGE